MSSRKELETITKKYAGQLPVPVIAIAKDLGLKVYMTDDFQSSQSGSLVKENGEFVIYVNEKHVPVRRRFTVAHEIAHYVLHGKQFEEGHEHIDGTKQPVAFREDGKAMTPSERKIEIEANTLAAEILMPKDDFTLTWKESSSMEELADKFEVSQAAASIRAQKLFSGTII